MKPDAPTQGVSDDAKNHKAFVRLISGAPDWSLHLLNGGVKTIAGRTLDPRIRLMERLLARDRLPGAPTLESARRGAMAMTASLSPVREGGVTCTERIVADRPVRVRQYRARNTSASSACLVYAHFGGGVVGDLETCDWFCSLIALRAGIDVWSVDYRLAPEHPFPAGFEDVLAVFRLCASGESGHRWVGIGGDSIGGSFAAAVAVETARRGERTPDLQLLVYPALDLFGSYESRSLFAQSFPLDGDTGAWFMEQYLPPGADLSDPRLAQMSQSGFGAKTPAIIVAAGHDILADEACAYAQALSKSGGRVGFRMNGTLCHGFTGLGALVPAARRACAEIADDVRAYADAGVDDNRRETRYITNVMERARGAES